MRLYHGSARYDDIVAQGLDPAAAAGLRNDFGGGGLDSLGGVYLTDSPAVAAFYAAKATGSESSHAMDPCVFAVEVSPESLMADEDKVMHAFEREFERAGITLDDYEREELLALVPDPGHPLVAAVRRRLKLGGAVTDADVHAAATAFVLRAHCHEWNVEEDLGHVAAIDRVCAAARCAMDPAWLSREFGPHALTCRHMGPIAGPGTAGAGPRITGGAVLRMSRDGLEILDVERFGDFTEQEAEDFAQDFMTKTEDITGIEISRAAARAAHP